MKVIICFFLFWIPALCIAQLNPGAKQIALSNSDAAMCNDVFSVFNNMAGLDCLTKTQIGLFYSPSPFGFKELANGYLCVNRPFEFGSLGIGVMTYGFDLYKENRFTAAYSRQIFPGYYAGASINYQTVSIKNYGSSGSLFFNAGFLCSFVRNLYWGVYINNVTRASIGSDKNQLPTVLNSGFCYTPKENLYINAAIEKDFDYNPSLKFGIDYTIISLLSLRTGFSTEPETFTAGIGINYLYFNCDYSILNHPDLGITHQFGIIINFEK